MDEIAWEDIKNIIDGGNATAAGRNYNWGQRYGGQAIANLVEEVKRKISEKEPTKFVLPMRIKQGIPVDIYPHDTTIVTLEETTVVKPNDGEEYRAKKGFLIRIKGGSIPPTISAPNGKAYLDIVYMISQ